MKKPLLFLALACAGGLMACDPVTELANADLGDVRPPNLQFQEIADDGGIHLVFDESVRLSPGSLRIAIGPDGRGITPTSQAALPGMGIARSGTDLPSTLLDLSIEGDLQPGREYAVEVAVLDLAGNSLSLVLPFYGPNPHSPDILINEVLTKTSTKNRDAIELQILTDGNLGGVTVFLGVPEDFDACYSFPATEVKAGDYLILHCKPEGKTGELDEDANPDSPAALAEELARSVGLNSSIMARDFWWREAPGLPDDSGIITIAANPLGRIRDAVFYTNKTTVAGKEYRSFGTRKFLERAESLQTKAAWMVADTTIMVEDGASSLGLTATRSLCRNVGVKDTNSSRDWHVVPSGKASLGTNNSGEIYQPAPR